MILSWNYKFQFKLEGNVTKKLPEIPVDDAIHAAEEIPFMVWNILLRKL